MDVSLIQPRKISATIIFQPISVTAVPNAVRDVHTFHVKAESLEMQIQQVQLTVFDSRGRRVSDSGWSSGRELAWHLTNERGSFVANGVYLYVVAVRGTDGRVVRSEMQKLTVLR
jgi:hypothetical protein